MKKLITLSLIALFAIGNLMAFDMNWNGEARVRGGIFQNTGFDSDASTSSWKAQRIRLFWNGEADNGVKFVVRSHLSSGDVSSSTVANTSTGEITKGGTEITLDRAYIVIPDAFLGFTVTAGLQSFYTQTGIIMDANAPGYYFSKSMGDISLGFGGYTASEGTKTSDDSHVGLVQFTMNNAGPGTFGLDVVGQTNVTVDANHEKANYYWISPWYSMVAGDFSVFANPIILTGGSDLKDGVTETATIKKIDGTVFAFVLRPSYNLSSTGTSLSGDIVYVSGTDKPTEELSWKNAGNFYCSGLEYFGAAGDLDNGTFVVGNPGQNGQMSFIVKADQPLNSSLTAHFAAGYVMTAEDVEYTKDGKTEKDNVLGTEINASIRWAVKDNVTWKFVAGYVMPGDATTQGGKDDAVTLLGTYLGYSF